MARVWRRWVFRDAGGGVAVGFLGGVISGFAFGAYSEGFREVDFRSV